MFIKNIWQQIKTIFHKHWSLMYEIKTKDVYEDFSNDKNNDKEHKKAKGEMNVFIYMNRCIHYTIKKTKKN